MTEPPMLNQWKPCKANKIVRQRIKGLVSFYLNVNRCSEFCWNKVKYIHILWIFNIIFLGNACARQSSYEKNSFYIFDLCLHIESSFALLYNQLRYLYIRVVHIISGKNKVSKLCLHIAQFCLLWCNNLYVYQI